MLIKFQYKWHLSVLTAPENHTMTECLNLEGTTGCHLASLLVKKNHLHMLPRTVSRKLQKLDIAKVSKDGGCTNSWDNVWQFLVTPQWKNVQREPPVFQVLPTASILSLGTAGQSLVPSFFASSSQVLTSIKKIPPWDFSSVGYTVAAFSFSLVIQNHVKSWFQKWKIPNKLFNSCFWSLVLQSLRVLMSVRCPIHRQVTSLKVQKFQSLSTSLTTLLLFKFVSRTLQIL